MRRYQRDYRIAQMLFLIFSVLLLIVIVAPILMFQGKSASDIKFDLVGDRENTPGAEWITNYFKMNRDGEHPDLLFFLDAKALTEDNTTRIIGKNVVFECLFRQETLHGDAERRLEYLTGATYSGFRGQSFENLGDRAVVPKEWIDQYEQDTQTKWNFRGIGIVITNGEEIFVLKQGQEYSKSMIFKTDNVEIPYYGAFEITSGAGPYAGEFSIDLTTSGSKIFRDNDLPDTFPAVYVIKRTLYDAFYFAGDFSQLKMDEPYSSQTMPWLLRHKGIYDKYNNEEVYWKAYYPLIGGMISGMEARKKSGQPLVAEKEAEKSPFLADAKKIYLKKGNKKSEFFIKGFNLGAALPGNGFTEFPQDKNSYYKWMEQMAELNANTIRVYTLLPPEFYQALYEYNAIYPEEPIYLLQEIWPEEKPEGNNYLNKEYNETYRQEIEYNIRAIHGEAVIPNRAYRSSGIYVYDVSPYLIGYLVGRELEPEEVLKTDELNRGTQYHGDFVFTEDGASPTEAWLAESCDFALSLEDELFDNRPLAAIVSWPTLDSISHDSEWNPQGNKSLQYNDKAIIDINHIGINRNRVNGFFGAYHIYPNYPDFMNNDVAYNEYSDQEGRFRYGGYLKEFIAQHEKYPALVAEYGLSTSLATAHINPDGYDHGGLSETEQAQGMIRMTDAIVREGYAGALVFEWMDEWTKKTWNTEYYMIPYQRHSLWHNLLDPEQNYGILANQSAPASMKTIYATTKSGSVLEKAKAGQDASCLNLQLTFDNAEAFSSPVSIALSTYDTGAEKKTTWEFNVIISPEPQILVNPDYNWVDGKYESTDQPLGNFVEMIQLTNNSNQTKEGVKTPAKTFNLSRLEGLVTIDGRNVIIKLPYQLIGFSDPSSKTVLSDPDSFIPQGTDQIDVAITEEIKMMVMVSGKEEAELIWPTISWNRPDYIQRLKDGSGTLSDYFKNLK